MTLLQAVQEFVGSRALKPICDDCIADHLAMSRSQVGAAIRKITGGGELRRLIGRCSGCCTNRTVTVQPEVASGRPDKRLSRMM